MSIPVVCKCGKQFNVKNEFAGKRGKCPFCGTSLSVSKPVDTEVEPRPTSEPKQTPPTAVPPPRVSPQVAPLSSVGSSASRSATPDPELSLLIRIFLWMTVIYPLWVYPITRGVTGAINKGLSPHWMWFGIHPLGGWIAFLIIRSAVGHEPCPACGCRVKPSSPFCSDCGYQLAVAVIPAGSAGYRAAQPIRVASPARSTQAVEPAWPDDVIAISGSVLQFEVGLIATPDELLLVTGPEGPLNVIGLVLGVIVTVAQFAVTPFICCLPLPIFMIAALIFDQAVSRPKRNQAWRDFLNRDLEAVRANRSCCKVFPIERLSRIHFDDSRLTLYARAGWTRIRIKCDPRDRNLFREFVKKCLSL